MSVELEPRQSTRRTGDTDPENDRVDRLTLESSWVVTSGPSRVDRL